MKRAEKKSSERNAKLITKGVRELSPKALDAIVGGCKDPNDPRT
jgi:hypothetical protein